MKIHGLPQYLVMRGHLERNQVAIICEVPIDAIQKGIEFIQLQQSRFPNVAAETILEDFEIWFQFAFQVGRRNLDPLTMLRIHKSLKHMVQILKNATCTKS
jgi:hypothetical protein